MRFTRPARLIPAFLATALVGVLAPTVSASAAVPVCADLQVVSFTVNPTTPIQGQQATIDVKVTNAGTCTAFGATVQWKLTPYATSGPSDQINSLGAGQTTDVYLPYTFTKAGNFESIAIVDTKNTVPETNEKNNTQILPVTVLAAGIDLSITSVTTTPDAPVADGYPNDPVQGRNETTSIVVHNGGNTAAGPFQLKWVPKPFAPAVTRQIASLGANSSTTINLPYTYQQTGSFKSTATVDATKLVKETNENNNTFTKQVKVDPQLSDLIVTSEQISPTPVIPGGLTTATITVKNQGNSPSGAFMLSWRPQPMVAAVSQQVGSLDPNESTQVQLQYTFAKAGSFAGLITADSTKVVKEINENNNTLSTNVVVSPNTVDLQITDETITGTTQQEEFGPAAIQGGTVIGTPTQGEPVHVDIAVTNTGNTHSGPFLVDWNPDSTGVVSPSLQTVTKEVPDLPAGDTTHVTFDFTYDVYGNFSTLTTLDPRNQVTETNEANNQNIVPITVAPAPIDLTISLGVTPEPVVRGSDATATITVTNNGNFPADKPFTVQWFPTGSGLPKSQVVQGLSPNDSTTITFTNTYSVVPKGGTYDSYAVVDSGNTIPETDEGNNTVHQTVTVVPQQTSFTVSVASFHAYSDGDTGLAGDGEWDPMIFAVLNPDPNASCTLFGKTIKGITCVTNDNQDVTDGENFDPHLSINLTLKEQTPLLAAVAVLEDDSPLPPQFLGYATVISPNPQYKTLDTVAKGQQGDCEHGPECFDAHVVVSNVNSNQSAAQAQSVQPTADQLATMNEFETTVQQQAG